MSTRARRLLLTIPVSLLIAGCGGTTMSQTAIPSSTTGAVTPPPSASEAPGGESPTLGTPSSSLAAGQTDTAWGRIWDTIPAGFPRFPGSTPADDAGGDPASAKFGVRDGDAQAIAMWMQGALEEARFSTVGLNGPAEDGSFVLDSVGDAGCRVQTTIAPLGDMTFITVLYGADCPTTQP
jgi:hypothetical protein